MNRGRVNIPIVLGVATVITLVAPLRPAARIEGEVADGFAPVLRLGEGARMAMAGIFAPGRRGGSARDGGAGSAELQRLRAQGARLREVEAENDRLLSLLDFRQQIPFDVVGARAVARDSVQWWQTVLIDCGRNQGVGPRMPVLADGGLLGMTTDEIGGDSARVLLLVDPNSRAGGMVSRSRAYGLIEGRDQRGLRRPTCRMMYVSRHRDIEVGDTVVTSGLGGVYPSGIPVGEVSKVELANDELHQMLYVELFADAERSGEVLVVRSGDRPWLP